MTCPYHGADSSDDDGSDPGSGDGDLDRGVDRREFMKSALVIGGTGALTSTVSLFGVPDAAAADADAGGGVTVAERLDRQHAWNDYERRDNGTFLPPEHHLLLCVDYEGDGEPTPGHRKQARAAFDSLEEAFAWDHRGLLFTVSYSVSYFDRYEADLPAGLQPNNGTAIPRMLTAQEIIDGPLVFDLFERDEEGVPNPVEMNVTLEKEDPVADDDYDAVIHLASDHVQHLLAAEAALWGEIEEWNGTEFEADLQGVFTKPTTYPDRRTGFAGNDNLADNVDPDALDDDTATERFQDSIDDGAPLSMGYSDLYRNSNPREDNATVLEDQRFLPNNPQPPGAFANGSIMHVSKIDNDLEGWYGENDDEDRRERMFSPHHEKEDVGEIGENLGTSNAPDDTKDYPMRDFSAVGTKDVAERTAEDAAAGENIGHAQKVARARAELEAHFEPEGDRSLFGSGIPLRQDDVAQERDDDLADHDGTVQQAEPGMLRRDFNTVDDVGPGQSGTHFVALQAFSIYIAYMRHAMNGVDFDTGFIGQPTGENAPGFEHEGEVDVERNGIVEYLETKRRGNFIMPPITLRALPPARSLRPDISVEAADGEYRVTVEDRQLGQRLDPDSVRFGFYRQVNAGRGASPVEVDRRGGTVTFVFDAADTTLAAEIERNGELAEPKDTARARLYGERNSDLHPVFATAEVGPATGEGGSDGGRGDDGRGGRGNGSRDDGRGGRGNGSRDDGRGGRGNGSRGGGRGDGGRGTSGDRGNGDDGTRGRGSSGGRGRSGDVGGRATDDDDENENNAEGGPHDPGTNGRSDGRGRGK